jgi:hypothetical protein
MNGIFGDMFDFNRDGQLDSFERAAEFQLLELLVEQEQLDANMTGRRSLCQNGLLRVIQSIIT